MPIIEVNFNVGCKAALTTRKHVVHIDFACHRPALYIAGNRDMVVAFRGMNQLIANHAHFVPQLRKTIMHSGFGHWTQQERALEVSDAMIDFLRQLR
jgi:hypothetical protein